MKTPLEMSLSHRLEAQRGGRERAAEQQMLLSPLLSFSLSARSNLPLPQLQVALADFLTSMMTVLLYYDRQ